MLRISSKNNLLHLLKKEKTEELELLRSCSLRNIFFAANGIKPRFHIFS